VRDAACPLSTRGEGGGRGLAASPAPPHGAHGGAAPSGAPPRAAVPALCGRRAPGCGGAPAGGGAAAPACTLAARLTPDCSSGGRAAPSSPAPCDRSDGAAGGGDAEDAAFDDCDAARLDADVTRGESAGIDGARGEERCSAGSDETPSDAERPGNSSPASGGTCSASCSVGAPCNGVDTAGDCRPSGSAAPAALASSLSSASGPPPPEGGESVSDPTRPAFWGEPPGPEEQPALLCARTNAPLSPDWSCNSPVDSAALMLVSIS